MTRSVEGRFWLVWNPEGRSPTYQHPSEESAHREAARLAGLNPGIRFYVLEAFSYHQRTDPVERVDLMDTLPF